MGTEPIKVEYSLPVTLPFGAKKAVAKRLKIHVNTVYKVLKKGESHPLYGRVMKTAKELYGVPVKTETV